MLSITIIELSLLTLLFCIISLHSLKKYLNDRGNPQKKHVKMALIMIEMAILTAMIRVVLNFVLLKTQNQRVKMV